MQTSSSDLWSEADCFFMRRALVLAEEAHAVNEVPVGAVVTVNGVVEGEGFNSPVLLHDFTAHAEIRALRAAALRRSNYRLPGSTLYVTLEPCVMCAGAMVSARVERLVFAARDIRFGAVRSVFRLADSELLNHRIRVEEGLMAVEGAALLSRFFERRRK